MKTKYYEEGRKLLEKEHMLMLLGDPGVGKTMLTKMLALAFCGLEGYRIRYTTQWGTGRFKTCTLCRQGTEGTDRS